MDNLKWGTIQADTVKAGDRMMTDAGFTCIGSEPVTIEHDEHGDYFPCAEGRHYLDGQRDFDGRGNLVGLAPLPPATTN